MPVCLISAAHKIVVFVVLDKRHESGKVVVIEKVPLLLRLL